VLDGARSLPVGKTRSPGKRKGEFLSRVDYWERGQELGRKTNNDQFIQRGDDLETRREKGRDGRGEDKESGTKKTRGLPLDLSGAKRKIHHAKKRQYRITAGGKKLGLPRPGSNSVKNGEREVSYVTGQNATQGEFTKTKLCSANPTVEYVKKEAIPVRIKGKGGWLTGRIWLKRKGLVVTGNLTWVL